jgi:hypothetical protein
MTSWSVHPLVNHRQFLRRELVTARMVPDPLASQLDATRLADAASVTLAELIRGVQSTVSPTPSLGNKGESRDGEAETRRTLRVATAN